MFGEKQMVMPRLSEEKKTLGSQSVESDSTIMTFMKLVANKSRGSTQGRMLG